MGELESCGSHKRWRYAKTLCQWRVSRSIPCLVAKRVNTATATADTRIILNQWVYGRSTGGIYDRSMAYDEIAIFNSNLSSNMVTRIYNSGVPTDLTSYNPVVWWRMEEGHNFFGSTVADSGTDGATRRDLTLINGPTFTTDIPS